MKSKEFWTGIALGFLAIVFLFFLFDEQEKQKERKKRLQKLIDTDFNEDRKNLENDWLNIQGDFYRSFEKLKTSVTQ